MSGCLRPKGAGVGRLPRHRAWCGAASVREDASVARLGLARTWSIAFFSCGFGLGLQQAKSGSRREFLQHLLQRKQAGAINSSAKRLPQPVQQIGNAAAGLHIATFTAAAHNGATTAIAARGNGKCAAATRSAAAHIHKAPSPRAQAVPDHRGPGVRGHGSKNTSVRPARFTYHETSWDKFPDGTDRIVVGGFQPKMKLLESTFSCLASFHDNDVTLSQFQVMVMLLMSFVESLTIVLPFYPLVRWSAS